VPGVACGIACSHGVLTRRNDGGPYDCPDGCKDQTHGSQADGSQANHNQANRNQANDNQANGNQAVGRQADDCKANNAQADHCQTDGHETDKGQAYDDQTAGRPMTTGPLNPRSSQGLGGLSRKNPGRDVVLVTPMWFLKKFRPPRKAFRAKTGAFSPLFGAGIAGLGRLGGGRPVLLKSGNRTWPRGHTSLSGTFGIPVWPSGLLRKCKQLQF